MARFKVAVLLDNVPQMLRTIVLDTLQSVADVEVLTREDETGLDALIVSGEDSPDELLRRSGAKRLIDIDVEGRHASIHWLGHEVRRISDLSPTRLVELIATQLPGEDTPATRAGVVRRPVPPPFGASTPPADAPPPVPRLARGVIALELGRLATRILKARGETETAGPAGELAALVDRLAAAARNQPLPSLPGLERMADLFDLTEHERDLLFFSAATEVEPRAARLCALLNDHLRRPLPTVGLVAALGGDPTELVERLVGDGPLRRFDLVSLEGVGPISAQTVAVKPDVWPLLFGMQRRAPYPVESLGDEDLARTGLPEQLREVVARAADVVARRPTALVAVAGDSGVGRREIARAIAARFRRRVLMVSGAGLDNVNALAREALWADAAVILSEPEAVAKAVWAALAELVDAPLLVVTQRDAVGPLALASGRPVIEVEAPRRDWNHRVRMWGARAPAPWPRHALEEIAARFDFGREQIDSALALARSRADTEGRVEIEPRDAQAACETLRDVRFDGAAQRLDCPFTAADIVLRPETRRELDLAVAWAHHGMRLFDERGPGAALRAGAGLACLFSGPPGTGKTMAAQIVARQTGHALYRIDLSQVVDKFIGESEKRLALLFDEAERSRVALFFDEADALFGKRTEVHDSHDRYANITIDYLLQKLDGFGGLAILATNLPGSIDDAFMRRIRIRADFPAPDAGERRRIWEKLLPSAEARSADIDLARLADSFELVGGEIRNAIYAAHLFAAQDEGATLSMRHCVAGLWRELRKTGRISDVAELGPWKSAAIA